jgi:hypothetical protein
VIARVALGACSAATDKGYRYAIALFPKGNVLADSLNNSRQFVPRHVGKLDIRVMAHPAVPVTAANARGHDLDNNTVGLRRWIGKFYNSWRFSKGFVENGFHCELPLQYLAWRWDSRIEQISKSLRTFRRIANNRHKTKALQRFAYPIHFLTQFTPVTMVRSILRGGNRCFFAGNSEWDHD